MVKVENLASAATHYCSANGAVGAPPRPTAHEFVVKCLDGWWFKKDPRRKWWWSILTETSLTCVFLAVPVRYVEATACATPQLCEAFGQAGAVFVGRVVAVGERQKNVQMTIVETFKGEVATTIALEYVHFGTSPFFLRGESYLAAYASAA